RVHREGNRVDIDEYRGRARVTYRLDRGDESERNCDHLITRPDLRRQQRQMQGARAGVHTDPDPRTGERRELLLEFSNLTSQSELAGIEYALDSNADLVF